MKRKLKVGRKEYELTADPETFEKIDEMIDDKKYNTYFMSTSGYLRLLQRRFIHHVFLPKFEPYVVDHKNGDLLDIRECNLRYATKSQNMWNRRVGNNNSSGTKNVFCENGRYRVRFSVALERFDFGTYDTLDEAEFVASEAAKKVHGEYRRMTKQEIQQEIERCPELTKDYRAGRKLIVLRASPEQHQILYELLMKGWSMRMISDYPLLEHNTFIHHLVLPQKHGYVIDHINGDKSDCRQQNLRFATLRQNQLNKTLQKNNTSGWRGVSWSESKGCWMAQLNGRDIGRAEGKNEAAHLRDQALRESSDAAYGTYNFPRKGERSAR